MSSCLRSASRLALAAESFAAAALSAHLLASCRRCSERVLILQVTDYFAATALPGAFGEVGPLTVRALRQLQDAESVAAICCHGRAAMQARGREWGDGAMLALLAAMVIVMAVLAFTLHRNSPLVAAGSSVTASEPSTSGQGGIAPVRGRSGIER
jgi:hypothetical protein